jgi:hypothetical protein
MFVAFPKPIFSVLAHSDDKNTRGGGWMEFMLKERRVWGGQVRVWREREMSSLPRDAHSRKQIHRPETGWNRKK